MKTVKETVTLYYWYYNAGRNYYTLSATPSVGDVAYLAFGSPSPNAFLVGGEVTAYNSETDVASIKASNTVIYSCTRTPSGDTTADIYKAVVKTETINYYAWYYANVGLTFYTLSATPSVGDTVYSDNLGDTTVESYDYYFKWNSERHPFC